MTSSLKDLCLDLSRKHCNIIRALLSFNKASAQLSNLFSFLYWLNEKNMKMRGQQRSCCRRHLGLRRGTAPTMWACRGPRHPNNASPVLWVNTEDAEMPEQATLEHDMSVGDDGWAGMGEMLLVCGVAKGNTPLVFFVWWNFIVVARKCSKP